MLERLTVENIVLVEQQSVELKQGFIALTGETGAGKSVIIDSIALCLGQRANADFIRNGAEKGIVQADFYFKDNHSSLITLQNYGIDIEDGEFSIRRKISKDGRSAVFVNGSKVNQGQIKSIASNIVDMHSQYDNQILLEYKNHIELLDNFAKIDKTELKNTYKNYKKAKNDLDDFKAKIADQEHELMLQRAYLEELELLNVQINEVEELSVERKRLINAEKIIENIKSADSSLNSNVVSNVQMTEKYLTDASINMEDSNVDTLISRIAELAVELEDIAGEVNYLASSIEVNPQRLVEVDERLFKIKDCAKKHKVEPNALPELLEKISQNVNNLENFEQNLADLELAVQEKQKLFEKQGFDVSSFRKSNAVKLEKQIEAELQHLYMKDAKFKVKIDSLSFDEWNENGAETVEFFVATNLGQKMSNLAKVASGGEVARLMLALKVVFFKNMSSQTLIFDEIDTGVGGKVADAVGDCLKKLSEKHQVIVISHQAQVASKAHQHLKIEKLTVKDTTISQVRELQNNEITEELARMISGREITAESIKLAESLKG